MKIKKLLIQHKILIIVIKKINKNSFNNNNINKNNKKKNSNNKKKHNYNNNRQNFHNNNKCKRIINKKSP